MLRSVAEPFVVLFNRWMPNPFIFAVLLTLVTAVLAVLAAGYSVTGTINAWGNNFWSLLTFSGQVAISLITGHALANTRPVRGLLVRLAGLVHSPAGAYMMVGFAAGLASLLSWAFGLIAGAVIARQTASVCRRRNIPIHYPLMVAAAYSGIVVWHSGLSSSIGLVIATEGHFLQDQIGIIPVSATLFSSWNMLIAGFVLFTMPVVMMRLKPRDADAIPIPDHLLVQGSPADGETEETPASPTPAYRLERIRALNFLIGGGGLAYLFFHFWVRDGSLNLNTLNFSFLTLGILLSRSPLEYAELVTDGGRTLGPILVQYPFYAGIMGMMMDSGLARLIADGFVSISTAATLPFWSMISGGILNIFIPSGGGQWAVQGPIMVDAAQQLGADIPRVAMGVAFGDAWTNMIQPFWTIPALAIAGLHVRDVMGYCVIALLWSGLIFGLGLTFL